MPSPDAETDDQQKFGAQYKLIGKDYTTPDLYAKVTGRGEVCRRLSRRGHAVLQVAAQSRASRAGKASRFERRWPCPESKRSSRKMIFPPPRTA